MSQVTTTNTPGTLTLRAEKPGDESLIDSINCGDRLTNCFKKTGKFFAVKRIVHSPSDHGGKYRIPIR